MEKIDDPAKMEGYLEEAHIESFFDTEGLRFQAYEYEAGELIISPLKEFTEILLIVEGKARIYGIREDGNITPVNIAGTGTILGDIEFCHEGAFPYNVEARTTVVCLALPVAPYKEILDRDIRFLHTLLDSLTRKLVLFSSFETAADDITGRLLLYMRTMCPDGTLKGVNDATLRLRCSRRQLQRVLRKASDEGKIIKTGKGCYRLRD